ncbi:MAG: NADH-quinone oxidoreductase subunit M [candidate division Zixibacteria bacterium]|nr:NADH-quinone oxidoreductase subunit M [candidate division Zixibacteria bacterium]
MADLPVLSLLIWLPVAGALVLMAFVRQDNSARTIGFLTSLIALGLFLFAYIGFDPGSGDPQFVEKASWIDALGISYHLGADGISLLLAALTALMWPVAILGTWNSVTERVRGYHANMLLMQAALFGVFFAQDIFLFYLFWEAMLIPMYFLIGIWGYERRAYAAVKFFLFAVFGSLLLLVALIGVVYLHFEQTGELSFDMARLYATKIPADLQIWLALGFIAGFAVKVPMVPFHTWLADAIVLAVVIVKMAGYGFIRLVLPMFPDALPVLGPWVCGFAVVGILYGALIALAQTDMKKLIAYSTVSHAGFVVLGVFAVNVQGIQGAVVQIVSLGLSTGGLFLALMMLVERRKSWRMDEYGGLCKTIPVFSAFLMVFTLASLGLPGLANFVGEFLILVGIFQTSPWMAGLAALGVILAAAYMLRMYKRVVFGPITADENREIADLSGRETVILGFLAAIIIWIGVYPNSLLDPMQASVEKLVEQSARSASVEIMDTASVSLPDTRP